ncbi:MAG: phosphoribosyltransferase family protein [Woeseiaceae bacterium]|nr:phosphoribosyltransferase family protein [Woeseiaceae bacterium]
MFACYCIAMSKHFLTERDHLLDGFRLGRQIFESGFRPTFIVGLWRGGSVVGIVVQECLASLGVDTDHIALRTSYEGPEEYYQTIRDKSSIRVHGRQYLLETINAEDRLLIVDDVFSSGRHTRAVIDALQVRLKRNMPQDFRVAVTWYRTTPDQDAAPDYFVHKTDQWIVLPWEMQGLSMDEIVEHKPFLVPLLDQCKLGAIQKNHTGKP